MRALFVDAETVKLPLYDDGEYWVLVKGELTAGEEKNLSMGALRRVSHQSDQRRSDEQAIVFDVDLEAAAFQKVATWLVDWNLTDKNGKTVIIDTPKAKRDALRALKPAVYAEIERVVDAHAEASARPKKAMPGSGESSLNS